MAWNHGTGEKSGEKVKGGAPDRRRWLFAGLLFAVGVGLAAFFVFHGNGRPRPAVSEPARQKKAIEAVKPATVQTNAVVEKEDRNSLEWRKKHDIRYFVPPDAERRADGHLYTKNGLRILEKLPERTMYANGGRKRVFAHSAEHEIARLLSIEPGRFFVGGGNYGPRFVESFVKSIEQPTLPTADDEEETRALKKLVNEVKADLKAKMDAGEDIVQIMKDTERELRSLSMLQQNMQKELVALRLDESVSEQDYYDYVDAANKMLQERGMKGISSPKFAEGQLKYLRERHKAKLQAKETRKGETK